MLIFKVLGDHRGSLVATSVKVPGYSPYEIDVGAVFFLIVSTICILVIR